MTATKTKKVRYSYYTSESFKDAQAFQDFLHAGKTLKYDYVIVGGLLYTMHEYDNDGKCVQWANRKHDSMMEVCTSNRYGDTGYTDAVVYIFPDYGYFRSDISYAE